MPTVLKEVSIYESPIKIPIGYNNYITFDNQNVHIKLKRSESDNDLKICRTMSCLCCIKKNNK